MNQRTLAVATLFAALMALVAFTFFRSPTGGDALNPDVEVESAPGDSGGEPAGLQAPTLQAEQRSVVGGNAMEASAPVPSKQPGGQDLGEEDPGVGVIFGNILNSDGARFDQGRVLVFENGRRGKPLHVLALQGSNMEFRCELPAGRAYQLIVDPESLEGDYTPPLIRSLNRKNLRTGGKIDPKSLDNYSFGFVLVVKDKELREDLMVGLPAQLGGRLLDSDGAPIEGALARLSGLESRISGLNESFVTGVDGVFQFKQVFPGEHRLTFTQKGEWNPPAPVDLTMLGGDDRWLGDVRAGGAGKSIKGMVVNQDGEAFPGLVVLCYSDAPVKEGVARHNFGSALAHATTALDGSFLLEGLPATPVKVSLTPNYNPRIVGGAGSPAMWVPNLKVDLSMGPSQAEVGEHVVDESRPFEISGQLVFDGSWLASKQHKKKHLQVSVSRVKGQELPEGVRRVLPKNERVKADRDSGLFQVQVETPMTEVELRFELEGYEDLVFTLQPLPQETWSKEIRVPSDFTKSK